MGGRLLFRERQRRPRRRRRYVYGFSFFCSNAERRFGPSTARTNCSRQCFKRNNRRTSKRPDSAVVRVKCPNGFVDVDDRVGTDQSGFFDRVVRSIFDRDCACLGVADDGLAVTCGYDRAINLWRFPAPRGRAVPLRGPVMVLNPSPLTTSPISIK